MNVYVCAFTVIFKRNGDDTTSMQFVWRLVVPRLPWEGFPRDLWKISLMMNFSVTDFLKK
jgi:hypothetical protein